MEGARPRQLERVALVGLSGSGKTTVARLLAAHLGWGVIDLDDDIASRAECTITELFENHGESEFRRLERDALTHALTRTQVVLATGGGAPCQAGAMDTLLAQSTVVWLDAPLTTLAQRLGGESGRPLLAANLLPALEAQWTARVDTYRRAHLHVPVEGADPGQVAETIARHLTTVTSARGDA